MFPRFFRSLPGWLAGASCAVAALASNAQEMPSSGSDIGRGDKAKLRVVTQGFRALDKDGKPDPSVSLCAPANAVMVVDSAEGSTDSGTLSVHFTESSGLLAKLGLGGVEYGDEACADLPGVKGVHPGKQYVIERRTLGRFAYGHAGWVYGPLVIPYKFNLHDRSFTGAPSVAAYVGRHASLGATDASVIVASGFGVASTQTTSSTGAVSSSSTPLFTVAVGLGLTLSKKGEFQIGLLAGKDWAGRNRNYEHEGKTWIALSFGSIFGR